MERTVTVLYNGEFIGEVYTNHSLSAKGAVYALGYDVDDTHDCEQAYINGFSPAYIDDMGEYQIDLAGITMR